MKLICLFIFALFFNPVFSQDIIKEKPVQTSIVNLIVTPEKFENKKVIIKGFLALEKENNGIYLTKDDLTYRNTKNSIFLLLSYDMIDDLYKKKLDGKYVVILGEYYIPKIEVFKKAYSKYGGVLNNVENVQQIYEFDSTDL
ncbi:hypothetical protein [Chryseobacterium sp. MA9]|uniref:hypothetical protein n=1 Tax=Chryseobacterium sp. MA9 TaxID=2966625 RepID=UPI002101E367|nr:hypothetical protein [Chryseobacterium sp. MA9]UTX49580.1 hypothetical protein KIK00_04750 [Chryseobacterium sp. MA9]